jgi:hypothetical protein
MQPNEQDQNQQLSASPTQNQAQPLPYAVPEYLHLDPVTGQAKRSFKKPILITLGLLLAMGTIGSIGYQVWQYNQPQALLYRALENSLQTRFVSRHFDIETSKAKNTIEGLTDLSDPANPKTSLSINSSNNEGKADYDIRLLNNKEYVLSIKSAQPPTLFNSLAKDQWYRQPANFNSSIDFYINETDPLSSLNMAQGILVTGNFTSTQRNDLMTYIKTNDVYHVTGVEDSNDKKSYSYTVQMDETKLNGLNTEVAKLMNTSQHLTFHASYVPYQEITFWVTKATNMITKMTYTGGDNKNTINTKRSTTYDYPKTLSIAAPTGVKELP